MISRWTGLLGARHAALGVEFAWVIAAQVFTLIGSLVTIKLLSNLLDEAQFGLYSLMFSIASLAVAFLFLPLGQINMRFLAQAREEGLRRHLLQFRLSAPEPLLYHTEPILIGGKPVGYLTSGAYGHALGGAVGLGYVPCQPGVTAAELAREAYEIEVAGERVPATASAVPLYDPKNARIRC